MPAEPSPPPGAGNGTPQPPAPDGGTKPASGGTAKFTQVAGKDTQTTRIIPQIASAGPKKTVLVCDDVTQIRKILAFNLKAANYDVVEAEDGSEAIKLSQSQNVDIILLDVMTPKVDGFTACGKIKQSPKTAHVPIIMLTACSQKEDIIKALSNGACDYIVKPFKKETVLSKIEKALTHGGGAAGAPVDALAAPPPSPPAPGAPPPSAAPAHS